MNAARIAFLGAIAACAGLTSAGAADNAPFARALAATKPIIDVRLRSESVDQAGLAENASAVTLRARLGFETGSAWSTRLLAEGEFVWPLVADYNSTVNGATQYPVVADPEDYALNRLQLVNSAIPGTTLVVGRQRLNFDDQRFAGAVGWRQNEQTLDALRLTNVSLHGLTLDFVFVDQVNRVFGQDSPVGRYRGPTYLAHAAYQTPAGVLTGFAYLLHFDRAPTDSSRTVGLRFAGERALKGIALKYAASYAAQRDYAQNPLDYADDYYLLELTGSAHGLSGTIGREVLEGDGVKGFSAPLGTLHRFQGWADKFLTTPANGIDDRYVGAAFARKPMWVFDSLSVQAVEHWYGADRGGVDYGTEFDVELQLKRRQFTFTAKFADYDARAFATDTAKFWLQLEYLH